MAVSSSEMSAISVRSAACAAIEVMMLGQLRETAKKQAVSWLEEGRRGAAAAGGEHWRGPVSDATTYLARTHSLLQRMPGVSRFCERDEPDVRTTVSGRGGTLAEALHSQGDRGREGGTWWGESAALSDPSASGYAVHVDHSAMAPHVSGSSSQKGRAQCLLFLFSIPVPGLAIETVK